MTGERAKQILLLYRPGTTDAQDPEVADALAAVEADPGLRAWFEQHCEFQAAMRSRLRAIEVPPGLKETLLARGRIVPLPRAQPWWHGTPALAAAAAVVATVIGLWVFGGFSREGARRYADYQSRMVATILREYRMDVETPNLEEVRGYMRSKGSPDDFELTAGLQRMELAGGGFLRWRNHPVSMVCFRRQDKQMVYLFVMKKELVKDPPSPQPRISQVHDLQTATWSSGDKAYLLAAPPEPDFAQKYL